MNSISYKVAALALLVGISSAWAEVTPFLIRLTVGVNDEASYQVPSGKVLIIQHARISGAGLAAPVIQIGMTILNAPYFADVPVQIADGPLDQNRLYPIVPSIRLGGSGARLTIPPGMTSGTLYFWGLLVDANDLYAAAIPLELENPRLAEGRFLADAKAASPRPRVLRIEASEELKGFASDASARVTRTPDPGRAVVSVTAAGDERFMQARAIARSEDP